MLFRIFDRFVVVVRNGICLTFKSMYLGIKERKR